MKTILVPTDFSPCAVNALYYAAGLAQIFEAKIIIHNSCHIPSFASQVPIETFTEENILSDASDHIKKYINDSLLSGKNICIEEHVDFGLAADNIVSFAEESNTDLIVMGTMGSSGIEEIFLGSISANVMEKAPCPVIIVPANAKFKSIKKIIFATDYRENDIRTISRLSEIADKFNAEIIIVHISDITHTDTLERDIFSKFKDDIIEKVSYKNISFRFEEGFHVADDINKILEDTNADLLSMSTHKRNLLKKLFERSLTKKMAYHTRIPILAFHSDKK